MKPGDSVGFKEGWAGEIPPGCVPRQAAAAALESVYAAARVKS